MAFRANVRSVVLFLFEGHIVGKFDELKRLADAATHEYWFFGADPCANKAEALEICRQNIEPTTNEIPYFYVVYLEDGRRIALIGNGPTSAQNAAYIASANPATILALIARLEAAEAELERLRSQEPVVVMSMAEWDAMKKGEDAWCSKFDREMDCSGTIPVLLYAEPKPPAHKGATHCDNCGCTWLDDGLNPLGCPYCKPKLSADAIPEGFMLFPIEPYESLVAGFVGCNDRQEAMLGWKAAVAIERDRVKNQSQFEIIPTGSHSPPVIAGPDLTPLPVDSEGGHCD